jgi:hypothetical protein
MVPNCSLATAMPATVPGTATERGPLILAASTTPGQPKPRPSSIAVPARGNMSGVAARAEIIGKLT